MKRSKLTAPTDYFCHCPYCQIEVETNTIGPIYCPNCRKEFIVEFDADYFMHIAMGNIWEFDKDCNLKPAY